MVVRMRNRRKGATLEEIEAVYRREFSRFLRVATAIVGDDQLAEDAIDEAFVGLVRYRSGFRFDGSVGAWAWAAVVRSARQMAARRFESPEHHAVELATAGSAKSNGGTDSETVERVRALVTALPERQRLALFLRHYADLDYQTIAAVMGISAGTVAATLHKAHSTLQKQSQEVFR
jgi:RNA polymerase sigma-70 factor, ECF subfamily